MKRPWTFALIAAAGATLLVPSAFALFAPPQMLDAAVALGDRRLFAALALLFGVSLLLARLALWHRRTPEEDVAEPAPAAAEGGGHLR